VCPRPRTGDTCLRVKKGAYRWLLCPKGPHPRRRHPPHIIVVPICHVLGSRDRILTDTTGFLSFRAHCVISSCSSRYVRATGQGGFDHFDSEVVRTVLSRVCTLVDTRRLDCRPYGSVALKSKPPLNLPLKRASTFSYISIRCLASGSALQGRAL
jgi:hypothetical protein